MQSRYILSSFEPENVYSPREIIIERKLQCGDRDDYVFARVIPPLEGGDFNMSSDIDVVILAPRHKGVFIETTDIWPIHVFVCIVIKKELLESLTVKPEDVKIISWGLLEERSVEQVR